MAVVLSEVERQKRKLRKKLRQIENLEILDRDLNDEELDKLSKKPSIREELVKLCESEIKLTEENCMEEEEEEMKRKSTEYLPDDHSFEGVAEKKLCSESVENEPEQNNFPLSHENIEDFVEVSHDDLKELENDINTSPLASSCEVDRSSENDKEIDQIQSIDDKSTGNGKAIPKSSDSWQVIKSKPVNVENKDIVSKSVSVSKDKTKIKSVKNEKKPAKGSSVISRWRKAAWCVDTLDSLGGEIDIGGHEDLVIDCDLDIRLGLAVTSSRDTTVKVWSLSSGSLLHSLRGHTGQVSGVRFLSSGQAVSGGQDCTLRVWGLETGTQVSSCYTYNTITKLEVLQLGDQTITVSGTDGGKLEVYDVGCGRCLWSQRVHDESVSAISIKKAEESTLVVSGGKDGLVKLFRVVQNSENQGVELSCIFVSENVKTDPDTSLHTRPVCSISVGGPDNSLIYYGDFGCNIKILDWKRGHLFKLANHKEDVGFTDCLSLVGDLLVSSTYNIDIGQGGFNLFLESNDNNTPQYVATLMDADTSRVIGLRAKTSGDTLAVISCGQEVKVWSQVVEKKKKDGSSSIRSGVLMLDEGLVLDSGTEEEDDDEVEDRSESVGSGDKFTTEHLLQKSSSGFCNCTIM